MIEKAQVSRSGVTGEAGKLEISGMVEEIEVVVVEVRTEKGVDSSESKLEILKETEV